MSTKSNCMDLKETQGEFRTRCGCARYEAEKPCAYCPFIRDVLEMAQEASMEIPAWNNMAMILKKRYCGSGLHNNKKEELNASE
jgi:hypothetical protein